MSKELARKLKIHVIANNWEHYGSQSWVEALLEAEKQERENRNREKRVKDANVGSFSQCPTLTGAGQRSLIENRWGSYSLSTSLARKAMLLLSGLAA